jgi:hypothetical protein
MFTQLKDTSPDVEVLQLELLRKADPARKLAMMAQMNATVRTLVLTGLRSRYPNDPPEIIRRRLADLLLGEELAQKAFGPASYAI